MNLLDLLAEISDQGWYIYSIRERTPEQAHMPDRYICTLRCEAGLNSYIGYGQASDLALAIAFAINAMEARMLHVENTIVAYDEPAIDLRTILAARLPRIQRRV